MALLPYTQLHHNCATLRTSPKFVPKVASACHINQAIKLPTFYPKPQASLEEQRLHTLDWTKPIKQGTQPFVSFDPNRPGQPVTKQTLSQWISDCITFCHNRAGTQSVRTHQPQPAGHAGDGHLQGHHLVFSTHFPEILLPQPQGVVGQLLWPSGPGRGQGQNCAPQSLALCRVTMTAGWRKSCGECSAFVAT